MEKKTLQNGNLAEEAQEERKRYITRLYRRAQTQIANDLGADGSRNGADEQVGAMIDQIIEATGARLVTVIVSESPALAYCLRARRRWSLLWAGGA